MTVISVHTDIGKEIVIFVFRYLNLRSICLLAKVINCSDNPDFISIVSHWWHPKGLCVSEVLNL